MSEASTPSLRAPTLGCAVLYLVFLALALGGLASVNASFSAYRTELSRYRKIWRKDRLSSGKVMAQFAARAGRDRVLAEVRARLATGRDSEPTYGGVLGEPYPDSLLFYTATGVSREGEEVSFEVTGRLVARGRSLEVEARGAQTLRVRARVMVERVEILAEDVVEPGPPLVR